MPNFRSAEGKVYALEPETFAADSRDFAARLEDRKRDTCKLARWIETPAMESRHAAYAACWRKSAIRSPADRFTAVRSPASGRPASRARLRGIPRRRTLLGKSGGE